MEWWLSNQKGNLELRLPVLPSNFEVVVGSKNTRVNINKIGDINLIGRSGLREMSLESFFPAQDYYFVEYADFPEPYKCVELIDSWRLAVKPIRVIVTETPINMLFAIDSFSYREQDGTGDIYYTLELSEYKLIGAQAEAETGGNKSTSRPAKSVSKGKTYTVKSGDSLLAIAKREAGDSDKWRDIYDKNKEVIGNNPNSILPGQKLVL